MVGVGVRVDDVVFSCRVDGGRYSGRLFVWWVVDGGVSFEFREFVRVVRGLAGDGLLLAEEVVGRVAELVGSRFKSFCVMLEYEEMPGVRVRVSKGSGKWGGAVDCGW